MGPNPVSTVPCEGEATEDPILAAYPWNTNGDLIADVARLYFQPDDAVLDVTYGRGVWWKKFTPAIFTWHSRELNPESDFDFCNLPYEDNSYDVVAYDPPYTSIGGRKGSKMSELHERFGLIDAPTSPKGLQVLMDEGLDEVVRVSRRLVLYKCQDYISSGKFWPGTHYALTHALDIGCTILDRFERTQPNPRPQPSGRTRKGKNGERIPTVQQHARRNISTLFVLEVPK